MDLGRHVVDSRYDRLPYCIRSLATAMASRCDEQLLCLADVERLICFYSATHRAPGDEWLPIKPTRVVLQGFSGLSPLLDLAAMRQVVQHYGGDPQMVQPAVPVDILMEGVLGSPSGQLPDGLSVAEVNEFSRCEERFLFLKWAATNFRGVRLVPPGTDMLHSTLLQHLSRWIVRSAQEEFGPDVVMGVDSHLAIYNGLGILSLGMSILDVESAILDLPVQFNLPEVVGCRIIGQPPPLATNVEVVLFISKFLRQQDELLSSQFIEFFGPALQYLSVTDRMTIANTSTEYSAAATFFPADQTTLDYISQTVDAKTVSMIENYLKARKLLSLNPNPNLLFCDVLEVNLSDMKTTLSGPHPSIFRVDVSKFAWDFRENLMKKEGERALAAADVNANIVFSTNDKEQFVIKHGSVMVATIPTCANASHPTALLSVGLLARNAQRHGLSVKKYTHACISLRTGLGHFYLRESGLLAALEHIGFSYLLASGPSNNSTKYSAPPGLATAISKAGLVTCGLMSGTHTTDCCEAVLSATSANYTVSPPLVVVYALAGRVDIDFSSQPIGLSKDGSPVYLQEIWPSREEVLAVQKRIVLPAIMREAMEKMKGVKQWRKLPTKDTALYPWDPCHTYIQRPPFASFQPHPQTPTQRSLARARCLLFLGDNVPIHRISPAGSMARNSPAARFLAYSGLESRQFNTYGSRVGNHAIMARGMFAHKFLNNSLSTMPGPRTIFLPTGEEVDVYDAAIGYLTTGVPQIILAGDCYGSGSARDWAAKGLIVLGVRVVLAAGFSETHRSNLASVGILPLQFLPGQSAETFGLTGCESFSISLPNELIPNQRIEVKINTGRIFQVELRLDTLLEVEYFCHDGMVNFQLCRYLAA